MQKKVSLLVFVFFSSYIVIKLLKTIHTVYFTVGGFEYRSFSISDWLINYEGGFVRRGLMGQLLYLFTKIQFCDVRIIIMWIVFVTSALFLGLTVSIFRREGFSPLIIPTGCFAGFTLFSLYGRRDMLTFLLMYLIFLMYKKVQSSQQYNILLKIVFYVLSIMLILIHESAFFYTFPFLMFICYRRLPISQSFVKKISRSIVEFLPILLTMAIVCVFKGNKEIADSIWNSWSPVVNAFPDFSEGGKIFGLDALSWKTIDTILLHLRLSYLGANASVFRIFVVMFNWMAVYYLLTRLDVLKRGESTTMNHTYMSDIVLVQFIFLIPMFGILSSDWGRTLPYWAVSSVFLYHVFKSDFFVSPSSLSSLSQKLQGLFMNKKELFLSPYFYLMILLVTPFSLYWAPDINNLIQTDLLRYARNAMLMCFTQ